MLLRIVIAVLALLCSAVHLHADDLLNRYMYADTKRLVKLVEDAASLMERKGTAAFAEFGRSGSRWFNDQFFLFVYDSAGVNTFHPTIPELVGKNLMDLRDMNGKPLIRFITDVCRKPKRDAHGWVFYLWQEKNEFEPKWKSAYIRKVVLPDGNACVIGAGHHFLKIEKVMVQENVQSAVDLLMAEGKRAAFKQFLDPTSRYGFLNTFIWVTDERGRALVDPAFPEKEGRDLSLFQDAIGRQVMKEIIEKLRKDDEAWVQYLWPRPGAVTLSRKLAYVKKARVGEETLLVGCDFFLTSPIWMKQ
ncbi:MAG TPA: cache domain-containing protein [Thermodesulfobacteriota bacterium]|nr:cache domain-containing protein [Thermodesulfobacteriota bacterium]